MNYQCLNALICQGFKRKGRILEKNIDLVYMTQPPKKWTFEQPKLKVWVEKWAYPPDGYFCLNLFAGKTKLGIREYRVDISDEFNPDKVMDAYDFVMMCKENKYQFGSIVWDPPYNLRKSREKYKGKYVGSLTKIKNELSNILIPGGKIVSLGYDTVGMSKSRGYQKIAVCVVCHNGDHNDTLGLVEKKIK